MIRKRSIPASNNLLGPAINPANELATKEEILKSSLEITNSNHPMVYFLISGGEIVYVGSTENGLVRLLHHLHIKKIAFDSFSYLRCNISDLTYVESLYIAKYSPRFNKRIPPQQPLQIPKSNKKQLWHSKSRT